MVSLAYVKCGERRSAALTIVLALLTLVPVNFIRWFAVICVALITLCYILFRTALGKMLLLALGRDSTGKKLKP